MGEIYHWFKMTYNHYLANTNETCVSKSTKSTKDYILSDIHACCYLFKLSDATEMNLVYLADFKGIPKTVNQLRSGSTHPDPLHYFPHFTSTNLYVKVNWLMLKSNIVCFMNGFHIHIRWYCQLVKGMLYCLSRSDFRFFTVLIHISSLVLTNICGIDICFL